jgi:hypothetical protein
MPTDLELALQAGGKKKEEETELQKALKSGGKVKGREERGIKQTISEFARPTLEFGGMGLGGALGGGGGTLVAPGAGTVGGTVAGAGLGFAGGKQLADILDTFLGIQKPKPIGRDIAEIPQEVAEGATLEMGGQVLGPVLSAIRQKAISPLGRQVSDRARQTIDLFKGETERVQSVFRPVSSIFKQRKPVLTPAQATENRMLDIVENVAEFSLFGGGTIRNQKINTTNLINRTVDDFANAFTRHTTRGESRAVIQDVLKGESTAFRATGSNLFKQVDELIPRKQPVVDTRPLKEAADTVLEQINKSVVKSPKTRKLIKQIQKLDDVITFEQASINESDLGAITRQINELVPGKAEGAAKLFKKEISKAIDDAEKVLPEGALDAYKNAKTFWKQGKQLFNDKLVVRLAELDRDKVVDSLLTTKEPVFVKKLRDIIVKRGGREDVWEGIQGDVVNRVLNTATDVDNVLSGKTLLKQLKSAGDDTLNAFFPEGQHNLLRKYGEALRLVEQQQSEGIGRVAIQLTQIGQIVPLLQIAGAGAIIGYGDRDRGSYLTALAILGGPAVLGRAMTNPVFMKWLTNGVKVNKGFDQYLLKGIAILKKDGIKARILSDAEKEGTFTNRTLQSAQGASTKGIEFLKKLSGIVPTGQGPIIQ